MSSCPIRHQPTDLVAEFPRTASPHFPDRLPEWTPDAGLTWRYIDGGWTDGWDVSLCDLGECYRVPSDTVVLPMPEAARVPKLIVNALESRVVSPFRGGD